MAMNELTSKRLFNIPSKERGYQGERLVKTLFTMFQMLGPLYRRFDATVLLPDDSPDPADTVPVASPAVVVGQTSGDKGAVDPGTGVPCRVFGELFQQGYSSKTNLFDPAATEKRG